MKVYIITRISFPNGMASAQRIRCYMDILNGGGIECELLIYHHVFRNCSSELYSKQTGEHNHMPFRYIGGVPSSTHNLMSFVWNRFLDEYKLVNYIKQNFHKGDVALYYPIRDAKMSIMMCKLVHQLGGKFVYELCELPGIIETRKIFNKRKMIEKKLFPKCDGIIPISDSLTQYVKQFTTHSCKYLKIPILVDFEKYDLEDKSLEAEVPYIFHAGTLTEQKDGILGMIEAFGEVRKKLTTPLKFICTGDVNSSPHVVEIQQLITKYQLENDFIFVGYLRHEEIQEYLQKASLVIINKNVSIQNQYCFSTKLGEYMAAGKAIVITRVGEAMNWLTDGKDACVVEPGDTIQLVNAITEMITNENQRKQLGDNARLLCKKAFDYRNYINVFKEYFHSL